MIPPMDSLPVGVDEYLPAGTVVLIGRARYPNETIEEWRARAVAVLTNVELPSAEATVVPAEPSR